MKIAASVYESTPFAVARTEQREESLEDDIRRSLPLGGDTITISETGKELSKIMSANKAPDNEAETPDSAPEDEDAAVFAEFERKMAAQNAASGKGQTHAIDTGRGQTKQPDKVREDYKKELEKQIKEIQSKITQAQEKLQQAKAAEKPAESESGSESDDASSDDRSPEAKSAQSEVDTLTNQLMQLQQELLRNGPGAGAFMGNVEGTRAGSTGVGQILFHIGDATDPYAAAQAAEAAEMGGGAAPAAPEAVAT